jgi:hypothetical protein
VAEVAGEVAQRLPRRLDVGVDDRDDLPAHDRDRVAHSQRLALVEALLQQADPSVGRVGAQQLHGPVRRAVVHDDLVARVVERQQRGQRALDHRLLAVGGHDDRDERQLV